MVDSRVIELPHRKLEILSSDDLIDPATGKPLVGSWVWDASLILAHWLTTDNCALGPLEGKRVVELGAGTSIPGLVAATLGANVVLTDKKEMKDAMQKNIVTNGLEKNAMAEALLWGDDVSHLNPPFDVVLGSDIMYDVDDMPSLCKTIRDLSSSNTRIFICYELREFTVECFKAMKECSFSWRKLAENELHPDWISHDIGVFEFFATNE